MRRWLHDHLRRRGSALLWFGALDLVYAYALATSGTDVSRTYRWFATIMPLDAWAVIWAAVGFICLYTALRRADRFGFIAAIGIKMMWGIVSLYGAIVADVPVSGVGIWFGLAGLVWIIAGWPEPDEDAGYEDRTP